MKFKTEKLKYTELSIKEMTKRSIDFYNSIKNRRTVRHFDNKRMDLQIIKNAILSAGTAPNGANLQPWHFVIIKDKKIKKKLELQLKKKR